MASLSLRNVYKTYVGKTNEVFHVVNDFNLDIADKEFVVLVGPSGCGKSTTLRMIAGLEGISAGQLYIDGKLMNDTPPKDRDIAMVFQNYALYPHMTVFGNMAFALKLRGFPKQKIQSKVNEVAEILNISHLLERKPRALSGGQRQRVALGRAMVRNPKIFLMDEPLSNLDAKLRMQMRTEIGKLHKKLQTTFVYVTHDQTEAMTMGTRIAIMKDGIIQQVASPRELYEKPVNIFVAGFIGSPQMNFIKARVDVSENGTRLLFGKNSIKLPDGKGRKSEILIYSGREVIMGIRPQDVHNEEAYLTATPDSAIDVSVELVELVGAEIFLYLKTADDKLTARVNARSIVTAGDNIRVALDTNKIHLFDGQTECMVI